MIRLKHDLKKPYVRNFKNSKPLESSEHKKHDHIWTKITTPQLNNHEKTNKKEGKNYRNSALKRVLEEHRNVGE